MTVLGDRIGDRPGLVDISPTKVWGESERLLVEKSGTVWLLRDDGIS